MIYSNVHEICVNICVKINLLYPKLPSIEQLFRSIDKNHRVTFCSLCLSSNEGQELLCPSISIPLNKQVSLSAYK